MAAITAPTTPVIANVNAEPYSLNNVYQNLVQQIAPPVRWVDTIEYFLGLLRVENNDGNIGQTVTGKT